MKKMKYFAMFIGIALFGLGFSSCGDDEVEKTEYIFDGKWLIAADEWKGIVVFDKEKYKIEEYYDDYGYGLYKYKGSFYGTVNYRSDRIDLFSTEANGWLGKDGYSSCIAGVSFKMPSNVADEMIIRGDDGKVYQFNRTSGGVPQRSDIYGVWHLVRYSGNAYSCINGQKGDFTEPISDGSLYNHPEEIGISTSSLKNNSGYNAYSVCNKGKNRYLANIMLQGELMNISNSNYSWFGDNFIWTVVSVNENELKLSVEGPDGPAESSNDYLELVFEFNRVKTL